ncbi:ATP-binding protein [Nannocystis bainbridge]|uniref:ATP-binding protein n=1 Tax=Nannocystis bainbridge TaxID=2995303 RepID=A0ABT5DVA4_9BACT|nr:ATP-binding protein [Nannocystis bainbridge]MDC0717569.1 ATP-binding protein [Nannocystis bainbridge]
MNWIANPYRPGAGHMPLHVAGREPEQTEFRKLLGQEVILSNAVVTGMRGVGKTVLLERFREIAVDAGWLWVGTDLSEANSLSEERIAARLITDLALATSRFVVSSRQSLSRIGFGSTSSRREQTLDYELLTRVYEGAPGLPSDKLKQVLTLAAEVVEPRGIVFAYDEAQNLSDHASAKEYPLALLLDVFQSIQRREVRFMLVLSGLPMLFSRLVDSRTYAERMFRVLQIERLDEASSREAIVRPPEVTRSPLRFDAAAVAAIVEASRGYPYFIQFICHEAFAMIAQEQGGRRFVVPARDIIRKLDHDFFAARWSRATDRQRELLLLAARLERAEVEEFTPAELVESSRAGPGKPFSSSGLTQMLAALCEIGLVYKNRRGAYSFAVPLFGGFLRRQAGIDDKPARTGGRARGGKRAAR